MKFYLGVTDNRWFDFLGGQVPSPEDVNFWQPGGNANFRALAPGAPFLFKLKAPRNPIGGVGFFSTQSLLPLSVAWDTFGTRNGHASLAALGAAIRGYRADKENPNPVIGCIVLTNPVFFRPEDWIPLGDLWKNAIVQGKSFDTEDAASRDLWLRVETLLLQYLPARPAAEVPAEWTVREGEPRYREVLSKVRVGQGAFRVLVTDAYRRRCAASVSSIAVEMINHLEDEAMKVFRI